MAEAELNPISCNICLNANAKFHCNNCGDALCPTCKTHHLRSKGTKHHNIVPYAQKLNPKYFAGLFCHTHSNNAPEFWCETCGVPICLTCITDKHKGHECSNVTSMLSDKRDKMLEEMKTMRDKTVGEFEEGLEEAQSITAQYIADIDKVDNDLVDRAKEMKQGIDTILSQSRQTLKELTASGLAKLKNQEKYLSDRLHQLKEDAQTYQDHLLDANVTALLQFKESNLQNREKPKALETATVPPFTIGQYDTTSLEQMFGSFDSQDAITDSTNVPALPSTSKEMTKSSGETIVQAKQLGLGNKITRRSLIKKPTVESQFGVANNKPLIACTEEGLAWIETKDKALQLVDRNGSEKDTTMTDFNINDMALTSNGELLLADSSNICIKSVSKEKKISTLFQTGRVPAGLCCLRNNDIVVTFKNEHKVIIYSRSGQIRQTLDYIKFRYPYKVAFNKVNQDIYICDHESPSFFIGTLIAVGTDNQLRYEYTGQGDCELSLAGVCADQMGHVLITDIDNHRVHILNQEGRFIQYILTTEDRLSLPYSIDIDMKDYVWVGEHCNKCVMVAKYLQ